MKTIAAQDSDTYPRRLGVVKVIYVYIIGLSHYHLQAAANCEPFIMFVYVSNVNVCR